jgi:hypothetical protein
MPLAEDFPSSFLPHRSNSGRWDLVPLQEKKAPPKRGKDYPGKEIKMKYANPTANRGCFEA